MKITSSTSKSYSKQGWYKTHSYYQDVNKDLSKTLIDRLVKYAFNRLDQDIVDMIITKQWKCHIDRLCDSDNEILNDSTYQVNFTNANGSRISVNGIYIKDYKPSLDHGFSLDENQ